MDFINIESQETLFDPTSGEGNTTVASGQNALYAFDYNLINVGFDLDFTNMPLGFFGQYVENTKVDEDNAAFVAGFYYGKKLKLTYNYRKVEKDAVVGVFTNSDFNGGGTDGQGHQLELNWKYAKGQAIRLTQYFNEDGISSDKNYSRTFVDFSVKF